MKGETIYLITQKPMDMLRWPAAFLIIALIAAVFGFGDGAAGAAAAAKVAFFIFTALFFLSLFFRKSTHS